MNNFISFLFSQSILLPLIIGLIRIRKIQSIYYPFLALIILGTLTEFFSFFAIRYFESNAEVSNVWCLIECLLILYQFHRWRFNARHRTWYWIIPALCVLIWIMENIAFMGIARFGHVFRISYAFLLVMLSINEINYLITHENRQLFRNARFLICMGFIIFFLYQVLFEGSLYIAETDGNTAISNKIISLAIYVNVLVNIIYAVAMLFIPEQMSDFDRTMEKYRKQYH
jgi:hypothetical protein